MPFTLTLSLPCDTSVSKTIFENEGDEKLIAVVTVTDKCVSFNSKLTLVKQNRDGSITPLKDKAVPDGETRSIAFSVKPGEAITLDCNGERGDCTYSLTFPGTKTKIPGLWHQIADSFLSCAYGSQWEVKIHFCFDICSSTAPSRLSSSP